MNINDFLEKIYDELFYHIIVKDDFKNHYLRYFQNNLKIEKLTLDEIIEHSIFFWKNRNTICKNMARNDRVLKLYWIID